MGPTAAGDISGDALPGVRSVLQEFGFAGSAVESVERMVGPGKGASVRVRADGADWVLKRHPRPGSARLALAHQLEEHLAQHGFPVARIRTTPAGEALVPHGAAFYSLHEWVHGCQVTIAERDAVVSARPGLLAELGDTVAALHDLGAHLTPPGTGTVAPADASALLRAPADAARTLRRPTRRIVSPWQSLRLKTGKNAFDVWILHALPEVIAAARQLAATRDVAWGGPSQITTLHNDLNWENLVLDPDFHLLALLDFDNLTRGPRVLEVGAAAVVLAGAAPPRVEEFVTAYETRAGISLDRAAVRTAMTLKCTRSILYSVTTYLRGEVQEPDRLAVWSASLLDSLRQLRQGRFR